MLCLPQCLLEGGGKWSFVLFLITYGEVPHGRDKKQTGGVLLSTSDCWGRAMLASAVGCVSDILALHTAKEQEVNMPVDSCSGKECLSYGGSPCELQVVRL